MFSVQSCIAFTPTSCVDGFRPHIMIINHARHCIDTPKFLQHHGKFGGPFRWKNSLSDHVVTKKRNPKQCDSLQLSELSALVHRRDSGGELDKTASRHCHHQRRCCRVYFCYGMVVEAANSKDIDDIRCASFHKQQY